MSLAAQVAAGDTRSIARALRNVDDRVPGYLDLLKELFPSTGKGWIVGVTGNPGAGKSTLTDRLIEALRKANKKVGVLCVDPSSPYTGGAILGDRIRMTRHANDAGVFIRSVATRGHLGGLSRSARDMIRVLDAAAFDVVLVETVGVGQDELEITRTAHTTLVVSAPGLGDEVQAIKAGLLETADVFAVNKADRDGADGTVRDLELMIALGTEAMVAAGKQKGHVVHGGVKVDALPDAEPAAAGLWTPPILKCIATRNEGVPELVAALERHHAWIETTEAGRARRKLRLREEVRESLRETLIDAATRSLAAALDEAVDAVEARETDPYTATEELLQRFRSG
ncbi:MAG: methylmalonyl Co-A mutase-associated GTPase MeaB [Labilithrix sp.]|nr:methylmalonyl Co-A mutase-associated GTPase MeaB [Labilithrix sp.]MCW5813948.1 methylmalonyl Co-A mutase-associated GTPase MeaB [Labilithrix sp.]